jgi:hypothetical protein
MKKEILKSLKKVKEELKFIQNPDWYGYIKIYNDNVIGIIACAGALNEVVAETGEYEGESNLRYTSRRITKNTTNLKDIADDILKELK